MRVQRLDLTSYGHFRNVSVDLSRPARGLTIVVGPNEAGKSTMMRALVALLFGIERGSSDHFGAGRESLKIGALLEGNERQALEVIRQGLSRAALVDPHDVAVPEIALLDLLGGIERKLFMALFRVDHRELEDNSGQLLEADGEIGRLVFGASLGGAATLNALLRDLEGQREALFKPRGQNQRVNAASSTHDRLMREVREARLRSRDWQELELAYAAADKAARELRDEVSQLQTERNDLQRIRGALPSLEHHQTWAEALAQLQQGTPAPPIRWADDAEQARDDLDRSREERRRAEQERIKVHRNLDQISVDDGILAVAERVKLLAERAGEFKKGNADLPLRARELSGLQATIARHLERLGSGRDTEGPVLTTEQESKIEKQVAAHGRVEGEREAARRELRELETKIHQTSEALKALPAALDVSQLAAALARARSAGPVDEQLRTKRIVHDNATRELKVRIARLGFGERPIGDVERLTVPPRARIEQELGQWIKLDNERDTLDTKSLELADRRAALESALEELLTGGPTSSRADLTAARGHRDSGWQLVRGVLQGETTRDSEVIAAWAGDLSIADAYEVAVNRADGVADELLDDVDRIARIDAATRRLEDHARDEAEHRMKREDFTRREDALRHDWRALWAPLGIEAGGPPEMMEWRTEFSEFQQEARTARGLDSEIRDLDALVREHVDALRMAIAAATLEPQGSSLGTLLLEAERVVGQAEADARHRDDAERRLRELERDRPTRALALEESEAALAKWKARWAEALLPLGFAEDADPDVVSAALQEVRGLRSTRAAAHELERRIQGITDDARAFETDLRDVLTEAAPDLRDTPPLDACRQLADRLSAAEQAHARRSELTGQFSEATEQLEATANSERAAADRLDRLRLAAGLATVDEVPAAVERARAIAELEQKLASTQRLLEDQTGLPFAQFVELAAEAGDRQSIDARILSISDEIDRISRHLDDANKDSGGLRDRLRAIDELSEAARKEQEAEEVLAELAGHANEYVRVTLAAALLERAVADYGERHRGPILERANDTFSSITLGDFTELVTDDQGGRRILLAKRRNGNLLHTHELSAGTRDQLYLALRLAGITHHLDNATPVPLILDDLLVNFDDRRGAATLQVLADLGERTQVLLFTHHEHLVQLARRAVPDDRLGIAQLQPRDHTLTITSLPAVAVRSAFGNTEQAVLECLGAAVTALGKAEILERTSISEAAWNATIKRLVESGAVVKQGEKRAARYSLP